MTYSEMKDSGVEWIGDIPKGWKVYALSQLATKVNRKNFDLREQNLLSLSYGKIKRKDIRNNEGLLPASFDGYNIIESGDIVLRLTDLQNDHTSLRVGRATEKGMITSAYVTIRPYNPHLSELLYYALHSYDIKKGFYGMGSGVRQGLNYDEVKTIKVVIPDVSTASGIVSYLNAKCAEIDAITDEAKASIDEYKRWKMSLIHQAVTTGLNQTVKLKETGNVWIGAIPEHWILTKLSRYSSMLTPMRDKPVDLTGPIPWIRIEDYSGKYISESKEGLGVTRETVREMNLKIYPAGTVLCTSSCDLGKCAIVARELVSNQRFIGIIPNEKAYSDFLYYLMLSNAERLNYLSTGSIQANLSRVAFEQLQVQFPPYEEQKKIAKHLDAKCSAIDEIIQRRYALISDLQSYKKSLIYETVTGKRKVE